MNSKLLMVFIHFLIFILFISLFAQGKKEIEKTFDPKELVKIKLVLGDCIIKISPDKNIHVQLVHSYDEDYFEAKFKEKSSSIVIQEKFHGNNGDGYSRWMISIPEKTEIEFESATGDLTLESVKGEFDGNTGTGNIEVRDAEGEFDLNTGTGNILVESSKGEFDVNSGTGRVKIEDCEGEFDANSGTGRVRAHNIIIETEGEFNSGTGDVEVSHPQGEDFDLSVSSGTDDATLIMDGVPIKGYYEFSANARRGSIECPVDFDEEEEFSEGDNRQVRKSFTKGKKRPRYFISTGTGKAELKR